MKPRNLTYGVDDRPPLSTLLTQGFQQLLMGTAGWMMLAAVVSAFTTSSQDVQNMIRMGMLVTGLGAILQANRRGPIGSGYLCPPIMSPAFAAPALLAGGTYGLPTLFGMIMVAGAMEIVLARLLPRLRTLFPPEVVGVVMTMVGISVLPFGFPLLLADPRTVHETAEQSSQIVVGLVTLATMMGCTVWGRGMIKMLPLIAGMIAGLTVAIFLDCIPPAALPIISAAPWFDWPHRAATGISFDWHLLLPFAIACLATSLANVGDLTMCQKVNDANWKRADINAVSRGSTAFGVMNIVAGLLGTFSQKASSSNIGLAVASGATSRTIAYSFGGLIVLCAFTPKIAALVTALPPPMLGSALIYCACFMMLSGIQLLTSRLLDARRILMAGCALGFGLSAALLPHLYVNAPKVLVPILQSPVSFTAVVALALNYLMQLGNTRRMKLELAAGADHYDTIQSAMIQFGESVAARRETMSTGAELIHHVMESLNNGLTEGPITVTAAFDEYNLDLDVSYKGQPIELVKTRPDRQTLIDDPAGLAKLAGWLIGRRADHIRIRTDGHRCHLLLRVAN